MSRLKSTRLTPLSTPDSTLRGHKYINKGSIFVFLDKAVFVEVFFFREID